MAIARRTATVAVGPLTVFSTSWVVAGSGTTVRRSGGTARSMAEASVESGRANSACRSPRRRAASNSAGDPIRRTTVAGPGVSAQNLSLATRVIWPVTVS